MSFSDGDSSKSSLDTLRSAIFETHSIPKSEKKKLSFTAANHHSHREEPVNMTQRMKENRRFNVTSNNDTVIESELLGSRLTQEIKRLRSELSSCDQQKHEAIQLLQTRLQEAQQLLQNKEQENDVLCAQIKELEWENCNLKREKQRDEGNRNNKLLEYETEREKYLNENQTLRDEIFTLKNKLSDAEELGLRLARSVEVSHQEAEGARKKEMFNHEGYVQNFLSALKQKDVDINSLTRTVQDLRLENANLQSELKRHQRIDQDHVDLKHQYDILVHTQQQSGNARVQDLERQVKALTDQRTYLNKEKSDLEDQCLQLRKENTKYESRIFELRQKNQSQIQSNGDMQNLHATELESYVNKNRDLTFQLNANRKSIEELSAITSSQDGVIHKLRVELSVLQDKYSTLKRLNKQLLSATSTYENILHYGDKM